MYILYSKTALALVLRYHTQNIKIYHILLLFIILKGENITETSLEANDESCSVCAMRISLSKQEELPLAILFEVEVPVLAL